MISDIRQNLDFSAVIFMVSPRHVWEQNKGHVADFVEVGKEERSSNERFSSARHPFVVAKQESFNTARVCAPNWINLGRTNWQTNSFWSAYQASLTLFEAVVFTNTPFQLRAN